MEVFAGYLVDAVRGSDADEVVIVGHSSGSFLAVDVLDRALARDPALGRRGPRVALLTIGANCQSSASTRRRNGFVTGCGGWHSLPTSIGSTTSRAMTS